VNKPDDDKHWDFDPLSSGYDKTVAESTGVHARYNEVLDLVTDRAGIAASDRVLDLGTGTGNLAIRCAVRGAKVIGLDPSPGMLRIAQKKTPRELDVRYQETLDPFLHIPYPDQSFDAVVSTYAFHHVPPRDKPSAVREMLRAVADGGIWVMGDLIFVNRLAERNALQNHDWLEEEYFARLDELRPHFVMNKLDLRSQQLTPVTWVLWARKRQIRY